MTAPAWCPNLGVDCGFPDCVYLEAECATAEAGQVGSKLDPIPDSRALGDLDLIQKKREPPPPQPPLFPITADDIFKK